MSGKILIIAGSDSGAGAGIQIDIRTANNLGCFATTVITAITAQNSGNEKSIYPVNKEFINLQLQAIFADFDIDAIKIGMLCNLEIAETIYNYFIDNKIKIPIILDPVFSSSSGIELFDTSKKNLDFLKEKLIPITTIITPNISEAEKICDLEIKSLDDMVIASQMIKNMSSKAVLLKGGHLGKEYIYDVLVSDKLLKIYENKKVNIESCRGTGCALATALAVNLARKIPLEKAVSEARKYIFNAINNSVQISKKNSVAFIC